ncbi:MAG: hypothetical protein AAF664_06855 [Planctomycetota bacterium]
MSKKSTLCFTLTCVVIGFSTGCRQAVTPAGTTLVPGTGTALPPPTAGTVAPTVFSTSSGGASLGSLFGTGNTRVTPPSTGAFNANPSAAAVPTNYSPQSSYVPNRSIETASATPIGSGIAQTSFQTSEPMLPANGNPGIPRDAAGPRDGGMRVIDLTGGRQAAAPAGRPASFEPNVPASGSLRPLPNASMQLEAFRAFDRSMPVNPSVQQAGFQASRPATSASEAPSNSGQLQWRRPN